MDKALRILDEWKEKILFGIVLLATIGIAMKARPLGGGLVDVDAEVRAASITAAGADQQTAERALRQLEKPGEITPTRPDPRDINKPFYDDAHVYAPTRASAWSLTQSTYEGLPPIQLSTPGFSGLDDFDVPAGMRPSLAALRAWIPRDNRRVDLRTEESAAPGE